MAIRRTTKKSKKRGSRKKTDLGAAPNWIDFLTADPDNMAIHAYHSNSMQWYNYNHNAKDFRKDVELYLKKQKYSKKDINAWKAAENWRTGVTVSSLCKMHNEGMPEFIPNPYKQDNRYDHSYDKDWEPSSGHIWIQKKLDEIIKIGKKAIAENKVVEKENKLKAPPKTIQERMHEKLQDFLEETEGAIEDFLYGGTPFTSDYSMYKHLTREMLPPKIASQIIKTYEGEALEYHELANPYTKAQLKKMTESDQDYHMQLLEGYSHTTKPQAKKLATFYETLIADVNMYVDSAKVQRTPRKKKIPSKEKLVAKLKHKVNDEKYKLASINPLDIIGANELWVFNCKTRKIGKYIASNTDPMGLGRDGSGLSVKGTTILGFNEEQSIQKTLRKPEEQLKEFAKAGKVKLRKFLDEIKTTDIKLTGRINNETIILKTS
jgi:hypothetical protein